MKHAFSEFRAALLLVGADVDPRGWPKYEGEPLVSTYQNLWIRHDTPSNDAVAHVLVMFGIEKVMPQMVGAVMVLSDDAAAVLDPQR
jgi:hypothetical protein